MGKLHGVAGAVFAVAWFVFFDGSEFAKRYHLPYKFVMVLPALLCLVSMFMMMFVKPDDLNGGQEDMFGGGMADESSSQRAKIVFFIASFIALCALSVAIWKMSDTYKDSSQSWPGVALLIQCILMMICSGILFMARKPKTDDGFPM